VKCNIPQTVSERFINPPVLSLHPRHYHVREKINFAKAKIVTKWFMHTWKLKKIEKTEE